MASSAATNGKEKATEEALGGGGSSGGGGSGSGGASVHFNPLVSQNSGGGGSGSGSLPPRGTASKYDFVKVCHSADLEKEIKMYLCPIEAICSETP